MKKTYDCSHCRDQIDTTKTAFVFSPMRGECIHLRCFTNALSYDIAHDLKDIFVEEEKFKKKSMKERKKESKPH